jgi:O-antigen ligase
MTAPTLPMARRWTSRPAPGRVRALRHASRSIRVPSSRVEGLYYFVIAYSIVSGYLGVEVPLVAGGGAAALAAFCYQQLGFAATTVFAPIGSLLACIIAFICIQIAFHGFSVTDPVIRTFILWIFWMLIVQSLCLRPAFVRRCTLVIFAIGLVAVPNLTFNTGGSVARAAAAIDLGGNLRNANGLGSWFGFCLVSFAMLGLDEKRMSRRAFYWSAAAACLLIAGLSVSRGALVASAIAIIVGFRGLFRRGAMPLLLLIFLSGLIVQSGLFGQIVSLYQERGMEETGRLLLWPHVLERVWTSPLLGVGDADISTYIPEAASSVSTPHNSFLFFALASGIIPLALWALFWIQAGKRSLSHSNRSGHESFRLPFFIYVFINFLVGDINIDPWVLLAIAVAAGSNVSGASTRSGMAWKLAEARNHRQSQVAYEREPYLLRRSRPRRSPA